MGESKVSCLLLSFSLVSRKSKSTFRSRFIIFQQSTESAEVSGIDGEAIEFKWNLFPGFTSIEILRHIQKDLNARHLNPAQLVRRILLVSMFNDIDWTKKGNFDVCVSNVREVSDYAKEFQRGHRSCVGPDDQRKDQRTDWRIVYVNNDESISSSWTHPQ